jgi:5'-nucleotidase
VDDISKQRITVITIATTTPSPSSDESHSDDDLRIINNNISTNVSMETLHLPDDNVTLTNHQPKRLTIIHFNDVYNIEAREKEPVGGAARFKTAIDYHSDKNPLVLFSGDALAPSKMSVVTLGRQMVPVLNMCGVKGAVFGNHDFDHGVDHLIDITHQTEFPWLLTNVVNIHTAGDPLADGQRCVIINWDRVKVGLMGLVEREWLVTLPTVNMEDVQYTDYVTSAKEIIPKLKKKRCDIVIALTHMRVPNDERLAREVPEIDLILGGHDHEYHTDIINDTHLVKSGTDFRTFTELNIQIRHDSKPNITLTKHTITKDIPEDKEMKLVVDEYVEMVQEGLDDVIGRTSCILDGTFKSNRTGETNLGNLITDIMRTSTRSDCAVINSGTFRSDEIHPPGKFKMKVYAHIW